LVYLFDTGEDEHSCANTNKTFEVFGVSCANTNIGIGRWWGRRAILIPYLPSSRLRAQISNTDKY
jgi:hypothetical protein